MRVFVRAAAVAVVLYLPWVLFSGQYYGSPVPHTILAKSGAASRRSLVGFINFLPNFPLRLARQYSTLKVLLMPSYPAFAGWPTAILSASGWVSGMSTLLWTLPWLRPETRAASFALLGSIAYLTYFPPAIFPWYLCLPSLLAFIALSGVVAQSLAAIRRLSNPGVRRFLFGTIIGLFVVSLTVSSWLLVQVARQARAQQLVIEDGNRRLIGLYLKERAGPADTVMLEPLGYIGYYSGLKMYDVPGLSSREVVAAVKKYGLNWARIAEDLKPTWLVLRDSEIVSMKSASPRLLDEDYVLVRVFDVRPRIEAECVYGRPYLEFDSCFTVFHLRKTARADE
jgi:hypothetical protein